MDYEEQDRIRAQRGAVERERQDLIRQQQIAEAVDAWEQGRHGEAFDRLRNALDYGRDALVRFAVERGMDRAEAETFERSRKWGSSQ